MSSHARPKPHRGVFDAPYWEYAQARELRLQRCSRCARFRYPPGPVCPQCLSDACEWTALSGRGRVLAWTVFHRPYFPELPVPYTVVSVASEEGPILIGNLVNASDTALRLELPVRAVFEDVHSDDGLWRICQWEPVSAQIINRERSST